jgi:acyl-CoA synthetase (AMP-forming)/AMP-acid ligase II
VPPEIVRAGADADINVLRIYGLTEALVVSWNRPGSTLEQRMHTDGVALPEVELAVWDDDDRAVPAGTAGEIVVRGPNVCVGLFDDPEREQRIFTTDGWLRTGDVGVLDDDGYLAIVGRSKEIIIRGGINVAPREIEDLLMEMPAVRAAAVIGIPDERLGEIGCACVVVDAPITLEEAVAHLRSRDLATYKLPEMLRMVDALPTTPSGKVRKNELRDMILTQPSEGGTS